MKKYFTLILFFLMAAPCWAATHYVSSTGAAAWGDCTVDGGPYCSLRTANTNAASGDTVWMMSGIYTENNGGQFGCIRPANSGSTGKIWFVAYPGQTPILTPISTNYASIHLTGVTNVVIDGMHILNAYRWALLINAHNNEIKNCTFESPDMQAFIGLYIYSNSTAGQWSTHNWIHHNTFRNLWVSACNEGGDLVKIGTYDVDDAESNYNTIENNVLYHAGHTPIDNFGHYNVIRNNVFWNDGFKANANTLTGTATGGSASTLIDNTADFTADCGGTCESQGGVAMYVRNLGEESIWGHYKRAAVVSLTGTTQINYSAGADAPTFAEGSLYAIGCAMYTGVTPPANNLYGHRAAHVDSAARDGYDYILIEGNRFGFSAPNPGNDGLDGLSLSAGNCIVRYNASFGNGGPGLHFKNSGAASWNSVYNNTFFGNGRFNTAFDAPSDIISRSGIQVSSALCIGNSLKNNIVYANYGQFDKNGSGVTTGGNWCETADAWCDNAGDPLLAGTDLDHPELSETQPQLKLPASSPAINTGVTLAHLSGVTSQTDIQLNDAKYFQDGTWGSSLSDIQADWIAIGTVTNVVQISTVDRATGRVTLATAPGTTIAVNDNVWLYKKSDGVRVLYGSAPDPGMDEYDDDSTPPVISSAYPSGAVSCSSNPRDITIGLTTDENATCRYSDGVDEAYDDLDTEFSTTGGTSHSSTISLACGVTKTYYARCQDSYGNKNTSSAEITFSINAEVSSPGEGSIGTGTGSLTIVAPGTAGAGSFQMQ